MREKDSMSRGAKRLIHISTTELFTGFIMNTRYLIALISPTINLPIA